MLVAVLLFSIVAWPAGRHAAADETNLARRATEQRQARAMARELVSTVLDLQLRQLEENGLTDLPLYRDIRTMRGSLTGLVDSEMAAVVDQLAALETASDAEREARFAAVRQSIREIVVRLSVERRSLLRRLKAAEIAEQTRRLISLQASARDATAELSSLPSERRPAAVLQVLEDQRDVKGLFGSLADSLADVATWDGPVATAASNGLRMLNEAKVDQSLENAIQSLATAAFEETTGHQDSVLAALRKLLAAIEKSQGAADSSASNLADAIGALREQQQQLRDHVEQTGLKSPPEKATVEAQQAIANALAEFADDLAGNPIAQPLRDQAEAAARAATEALFVVEEATTLAEQKRAVDRLTALEQTLRQQAGFERHDRSAAELARAAEELRHARDELAQAATTHQQAAEQLETDPQTAGDAEQAAASQAAAVNDGKSLPADVAARIADAAAAARLAADKLASTDDESAARDAVDAAGDAFQRAQAAIEESLADTQRAEAAVRIGELARAAEAIERAAAAERELAATASQSAENERLTNEQIAAMKQVQSDITMVASKASEGVGDAAPDASETLSKALASSKAVEAALVNTQANGGRQPSENDRTGTDEPARGADGPRSPVVTNANETARLLTSAAAQLRREIGLSADELADEVDVQMTPVATAQQAVQRAGDALQATPSESTAAAERAAQASSLAEVGATSASQAARRALDGKGTPTDARDALDRAAISLAAREQQLRQDQQLARQLAQLAQHQQAASETIATTRQNLAEAPSDPKAMSPQQREQAQSLHAATRQFAAAQRATGQGAAMVSGQQQVMNPPIREALQAAERLPVPQLPGEPVDDQVAQANEGRQPAETAEQGEGEASEQGEGQSAANDPSQQTASSGKPGQANSASSPNGMTQPQGLGTGLVPAAPDETARMMAGPEAQAALAAMAAAAGTESMEDVAASETAPGGDMPEGTPASDGMNDSQAASTKGTVPTEGNPADSDSQTANAAPRDATPRSTTNPDAPWFTKLPPEVRAAIRASSSQPAPKGYEGRLKRYFESVE